MSRAREAFFQQLLSYTADSVFNPWRDRNADDADHNGPTARLERLRAHLAPQIRFLLIGEASGYQGCRISGIPFTSERLLRTGGIPRIAPTGELSRRSPPWSEPSATVVWSTLHGLGIAEVTALWNAFPWHPFRPGEPLSNRTPTRRERALGHTVLTALLRAYPQAQVFAVGRHAEETLLQLGQPTVALRHPSMGGATRFRSMLTAEVRARG